MLSTATSNNSYALFAAQTLKHKIVLDWRQLDEAAILGLRERLWPLIFPSAPSPSLPSTVTIQLKLALAALIVQIPLNLWTDPVGDLFLLVRQAPGKISSVLEVLALIPEQLGNRSIQFATNEIYYDKCGQLLERHIDSLIQMVLQVLQSPLEDRLRVSKDLLTCLLSWIQFGGNGSKIIETPEFLDGLFTLLHSSCAVCASDEEGEDEEEHLQVIETCCELLVELIVRMSGKVEDWDDNQAEDPAGQSTRNDEWFNRLGKQWIPILSGNLCKLPLIKSLQLRKEDLMRPLITITCEALELYLTSLMDRKDEFMRLSEAVLAIAECPGIPSNILELTFNFWAALPAELNSFKSESGPVEDRQEPFLYLFARLFSSLLRGPLIFRVGDSAEEVDKFREFRHFVGDCLKDCVRVLGSTEALLLVNSQLSMQIPLIQREAALFALRTISSTIDPRETEAMPLIAPLLLASLQELLASTGGPVYGIKMISAVVLNVGCYAEWLRYHSEFMGTFLEIISLSLDYSLQVRSSYFERPASVIGSSLQSLKYMCESCAGLLGSQYPALEALFLRVYPWQELTRRDRLDLTEAVSLVLSRRTSWSDSEFIAALNRILQLIRNGGGECLEDYAVVLECVMLPELPRTPTIFSQVFLPSFPRLSEIFRLSCGGDADQFCSAWLRVIQAALNNGTAGAVADFTNGPLLFWLQELLVGVFGGFSAVKQATLFSLTSSLVSGQFLNDPSTLCTALLSNPQVGRDIETWISERCNLLRVCVIYVYTRPEALMRFLGESGTFDLLNGLLDPKRSLSPVEIVALFGFLSALFGALQTEDCDAAVLGFFEGLIGRVCEAALLEWPLPHINDLAMLLGKTGRDGSPLNPVTRSLFDPRSALLIPGRLFNPDTSTPRELEILAAEYPSALTAACRNYRPKALRSFLKGVAETCRRRRTCV